MAIPWLVVLQSVPWKDVINNAPKVAEGAKKLWGVIGSKKDAADAAKEHDAPEPVSVDTLQARLAAIETAVQDLHVQLLASSKLIKSLADQNTQLISRIELNRIRVLWLAVGVIIFGMIAISSLVV